MEPIDVQLKGLILYAGRHKIDHTHAHRPQKIDILTCTQHKKSPKCALSCQEAAYYFMTGGHNT